MYRSYTHFSRPPISPPRTRAERQQRVLDHLSGIAWLELSPGAITETEISLGIMPGMLVLTCEELSEAGKVSLRGCSGYPMIVLNQPEGK